MDEITRAALGQDHVAFLKFIHLQELNKVIRKKRFYRIYDLSLIYRLRKNDLDYLLENKPRFNLIARLFYKEDVERARAQLAEIVDEIHDLGLEIPMEDE